MVSCSLFSECPETWMNRGQSVATGWLLQSPFQECGRGTKSVKETEDVVREPVWQKQAHTEHLQGLSHSLRLLFTSPAWPVNKGLKLVSKHIPTTYQALATLSTSLPTNSLSWSPQSVELCLTSRGQMLGLIVRECNPSTWEGEAEGVEFETILGYVRNSKPSWAT
jgi:hypothetical protein